MWCWAGVNTAGSKCLGSRNVCMLLAQLSGFQETPCSIKTVLLFTSFIAPALVETPHITFIFLSFFLQFSFYIFICILATFNVLLLCQLTCNVLFCVSGKFFVSCCSVCVRRGE